jgi:hypothetical protein
MFGLGLNGLWAAYHATFPPIPEHPARPAAEPGPIAEPDPAAESDPETNA